MKKGFTLVEILAVIILLGLIFLLAFPPILGMLNKSKVQISDSSQKILYVASDLYVKNNMDKFPRKDGNKYCITINELIENGELATKVYDDKGNEVPLDTKISVEITDGKNIFKIDNNCSPNIPIDPTPEPEYDDSIPNYPVLLDNMVPIRFDGFNWVYADITQEWFNYDKKEWANAVVLSESGKSKSVGQVITENDIDLWYVWIPRYKYQIFNDGSNSVARQEIKIKFEHGINTTGTVKCTDEVGGSTSTKSESCINVTHNDWYTHPAFKIGNKQLEGIWVGKFEVSDPTNYDSNIKDRVINKITIKPNAMSLRNQTAVNFYKAINNMSTNYYITNGDSHMIRNMEWGAVSYFTHSKYGLCTNNNCVNIRRNNNSSYVTGSAASDEATIGWQEQSSEQNKFGNSETITKKYNSDIGKLASTTQNIYGIYDFSGGSWEYVLGGIVDSSGNFSYFDKENINNYNLNYFDKYSFSPNSSSSYKGKLGDATKETMVWWEDHAKFIYPSYPWLERGGFYKDGTVSGIFSYYCTTSDQSRIHVSTRAVLCKK